MSETRADPPSPPADQTQPKWQISRRGFLVGMAATGTALALGIPLGLPVVRRQIAGATEGEGNAFFSGSLDPLIWFEVHPDDHVRIYLPKAEMGQGIHTSLAQIAAEELEVPWDRLEIIHASTNQADENFRGTSGSMSIASMYRPLRQAAATLREMLRTEAARILGQPTDQLIAREGGFEPRADPESRLSYGSLISSDVEWQIPEEDVPLKPASEFAVIGQSIPRVDLPGKVTGAAMFGYDARAEGMLFGAAAHPPTIGARMRSARPGQAATMPGVVQVVIEDGFAGVVATSRPQAFAASQALEVDWDQDRPWQQEELEEIASVGGRGGVSIQRVGNTSSVLDGASPDTGLVTTEYRSGLAAHATMEPQAALADIGPEGGQIWTSTQFELNERSAVAEALDLPPEQIEVIPTLLGGGFGRKFPVDPVPSAAVEAALLSRAVGAPVHVGWDRFQEMRSGFFRPLTHHRFSATLTAGGRIEALTVEQASGDTLFSGFPEVAGRIIGFDFASTRGLAVIYDIPNVEITVWRRPLPIPTGSWRGLGLTANVFAAESFIDELAQAAGADPLQFRLDHLPDDARGRRMRAVLETAADRAGWQDPPPEGRARGIACAADGDTLVAEVAEISLDRNNGQIRVHRMVAAVDCGLVVTPDGARAQIEGAIVMGVSSALLEEITVKDGRVEAGNFARYPLLRHQDAPEIETILLQALDAKPSGLGEPPIAPVAPAIANALCTLTGVRLRRLPMSAARVKAALET
jgi:isoquinoline 1-oxidoreductase beta subunit